MAQRRLATTASLLALGLVAGCGGGPGVPLTPPVIPVGPFTIDGGSAMSQARLGEDVKRVQAVWEDDHFWDLVKPRYWLPGPKAPFITGEDLVKLLHPARPGSRSYLIGRVRHATAATTVCGPISIDTNHVTAGSYLINTVAHENTHFLGSGDGVLGCSGDGWGRFRFTDRGYDDATLPWLVSYAIGDLAQCFSDRDGDPAETTRCFEHRLNGRDKVCRRWEECFNRTSSKNVKDIREKMGCPQVEWVKPDTLCPRLKEEQDEADAHGVE